MRVDQVRKAIQARQSQVLQAVVAEIANKQALAIVKAPPGSGKTELLVRATAQVFAGGERVAIAAQTNAQADDISARLQAFGVKSVIRLAGSTPPIVPRGVRVVEKAGALPPGPCVVVATARKWEYGDVIPFGVLFVDEAWQMTWSSFSSLDRVAGRFVLIGDPGQIPPVVTVDTSFWETTRRAPHLPAPEVLLAEGLGTSLTLPASWRLPADSAEAVRAFYDFDFGCWAAPGDRVLTLSNRSRDSIDVALDRLTAGSVAVLLLPTPPGGAPPDVDHEIAQAAVDAAGRFLVRDAKAMVADVPKPELRSITPMDIGICATHRVMNARMEELRPASLSDTRIDTAERWQGLQRNLMIVVHPLSGVEAPSAFDLITGRLCVMASRHRVGMLILAREQVGETLDTLIVSADQAVGRPDVNGRGHAQHARFWRGLEQADRIVCA